MKTFISVRWLCAASLTWGAAAFALSPAEVQHLLEAGEKITFVDVRANSLFKNGHVPGAINVPAALVASKQLPPLGRVIVYDDGVGRDAATAAAALNLKTGITAQVLDGGIASWESARAATTKGAGLKPEETPFITYSRLSEVQSDDVVLVDLRKEPLQTRQAVGNDQSAAAPPEPLTDLRQEFAKVRGITRSPFNLPQSRQGGAGGDAVPPLLVLIDNGDGAAQTMARTLKANGVARYVILVGGEEMLARKGRPGLGRAATTLVVQRPPGASVTNTNR